MDWAFSRFLHRASLSLVVPHRASRLVVSWLSDGVAHFCRVVHGEEDKHRRHDCRRHHHCYTSRHRIWEGGGRVEDTCHHRKDSDGVWLRRIENGGCEQHASGYCPHHAQKCGSQRIWLKIQTLLENGCVVMHCKHQGDKKENIGCKACQDVDLDGVREPHTSGMPLHQHQSHKPGNTQQEGELEQARHVCIVLAQPLWESPWRSQQQGSVHHKSPNIHKQAKGKHIEKGSNTCESRGVAPGEPNRDAQRWQDCQEQAETKITAEVFQTKLQVLDRAAPTDSGEPCNRLGWLRFRCLCNGFMCHVSQAPASIHELHGHQVTCTGNAPRYQPKQKVCHNSLCRICICGHAIDENRRGIHQQDQDVEIHRFLQLKHEIHHIHHPPQIWRMDFLPPQALHPSQTPSPGRHPNRHLRRDWNTTKGRNLPWKFTMNNWRMHV